jgi:hypothetical protein
MDDSIQRMEAQLSACLLRLQRLAGDNVPHGMRVNAEQEYAIAYDALVRAGARPALRVKYRVR